MADFSGKQICNTYKSILNIGNAENDELTSQNRCTVRDSRNNSSSLSVGIAGIGICVDGASCFTSNLNVYGSLCSNSVNSNTTITAGNNINTGGNVQADGGIFACGNAILGDSNDNYLVSCGDFFVGGTSSARKVAIDADTGDTTIRGALTVDGTIRSCEDVVAFYSSDYRLKNNLNTICNTQSIVNNLTGYSFDWNENSDREGSDLGIIAQDVQEVLPSIVKERDNGYLAVDYIKLIPVLIEEVKRLNNEIEALKES